jgi:general stress protein YciG
MSDNNENPNARPSTVSAVSPEGAPAPTTEKPRKSRGFAAMDPKLVSELAKRGGRAAHRAGTAHQFTSDEARIAGRKGGMATHAKRREKQPGTAH